MNPTALFVLIPLGVFGLIFLILCSRSDSRTTDRSIWRENFLISMVLWGSLLVLLTVGASLVSALNQTTLILAWTLVLAGLVLFGWHEGRIQIGLSYLRKSIELGSLDRSHRIILAICLAYILVLLVIALVAPPNTNDSLRYHMSRVTHWLQNQTVAHYNTPIEAQLYMPAWSELAIANLFSLAGSDRLANLIQWFSMLGSLVGVSLIAKRLGAGINGQIFSVVFCLTLPMGILQSTSTQTDYVTAFWAVCLAYFILAILQDGFGNLLITLVGLSAATGILTKGTFVAFAAPFLVWLGVGMLFRKQWKELVKVLVSLTLFTILFNGFLWWQNVSTFGLFLGPPNTIRRLANETYTPGALTANVIRNATIHLGTPFGIINGNVQMGVERALQWLGQDANDPATTLDEYRVKRYIHEDRAGNPWHFLTVLLILIGLIPQVRARISRKKTGADQNGLQSLSREVYIYLLVLFMAVLLFSGLYKWQSTGSRLQLPLFVLLAPLAGVALDGLQSRRLLFVISLAFLLLGLPFLLLNPSRPLLPKSDDPLTLWNTNRQTLVFRNNPLIQRGFESITNGVKDSGCQQVGLSIDSSEAEYSLWFLLNTYPGRYQIGHIFPSPPISSNPVSDFEPCAIICTFCTAAELNGLPAVSTHFGGFTLYLAPEFTP